MFAARILPKPAPAARCVPAALGRHPYIPKPAAVPAL
jgi:hypothetical protein